MRRGLILIVALMIAVPFTAVSQGQSWSSPLGPKIAHSDLTHLLTLANSGREGTDRRYAARHLKRAIERFLVGPLARLLTTEQVRSGDVLIVDRHPGKKGLAFIRDTELRIASTEMPHAASYLTHL